jgi:hypothetical protein
MKLHDDREVNLLSYQHFASSYFGEDTKLAHSRVSCIISRRHIADDVRLCMPKDPRHGLYVDGSLTF